HPQSSTLSTPPLHDALPLSLARRVEQEDDRGGAGEVDRALDQGGPGAEDPGVEVEHGQSDREAAHHPRPQAQIRAEPAGCVELTDRKSTRLNSSHVSRSDAV